MKTAWTSILITAVLAALASGAATWVSATWILRDRQPPSLHSVVHEKLDLNAEQDRRLDAIEARFAPRRTALEAEVRAANRELAAAIAVNRGDTPEVQAAVDHFHTAMGDLQKATLAHIFEMRSVLTPAQAEVFDAAVADALRRDAG
ncbi:periplasmic heavy metal sensor [Brevundimonas sp.]|uniref:Spy/CpxP family protein refolding chaperone n=1 Tax=Brevundimonas sp. TaxID=1871086 RepID=UPI0025C0CD5B|nr:periplasmic heavy metal sensor [Brevundimonas sp.]